MASDDREVKELLGRLPTVEDGLDKKELFEQISIALSEDEQSMKKKKRLLPILSVAGIFILIFSIPFLLNTNHGKMPMETQDSANDAQIYSRAIESSDGTNNESDEHQTMDENLIMDNSQIGVIKQVPSGRKIVHFNIFNHSRDYVIPVALIVPEAEDRDYHSEQMKEILYSYDLLQDEDYIQEKDLTDQKASFMLYKEKYYVSLPQDSKTIYDALRMMQQINPETYLKIRINPSVDFKVTEEGELLIVQFEIGTLKVEDITTQMIDSILLTAKSYGFSKVQFEHIPVEEIGCYQFNSPIEVPVAANPILLQ